MLDDKELAPDLADGAPKSSRPPVRRRAGPTSAPCSTCSTRWACATSSTIGWCAGSTTTRARRSSSSIAGREGQQQAVGGGGRYDGLAELLGGRPTPGIGFGIGLDRTVLALEEQGVDAAAAPPLVAVVGTRRRPRRSAAGRRRAPRGRPGVRADGSDRKLGKQLEAAAKAGARWAVIVGEELARGEVGLKDLESGEQRTIGLSEVAAAIGG